MELSETLIKGDAALCYEAARCAEVNDGCGRRADLAEDVDVRHDVVPPLLFLDGSLLHLLLVEVLDAATCRSRTGEIFGKGGRVDGSMGVWQKEGSQLLRRRGLTRGGSCGRTKLASISWMALSGMGRPSCFSALARLSQSCLHVPKRVCAQAY